MAILISTQVSGTLDVTNGISAGGGFTGSIASSSFAISSSKALSSSFAQIAVTASFANNFVFPPTASLKNISATDISANSILLGMFNSFFTDNACMAIGNSNKVSTDSLAQGQSNNVPGLSSFASGLTNNATGFTSFAQGQGNIAAGNTAFAQGLNTLASGSYSHAEGNGTGTGPGAAGAHSEGIGTAVSGTYSHAEGNATLTNGAYSHAEGFSTIAIGPESHAEGFSTIAYGTASHAEGLGTVASGSNQHVNGQYNTAQNTTSLFIIGNGQNTSSLSDLALFNSQSIVFNQPLTASLYGTSSRAIASISASGLLNPSGSILGQGGSLNINANNSLVINANTIDLSNTPEITTTNGLSIIADDVLTLHGATVNVTSPSDMTLLAGSLTLTSSTMLFNAIGDSINVNSYIGNINMTTTQGGQFNLVSDDEFLITTQNNSIFMQTKSGSFEIQENGVSNLNTSIFQVNGHNSLSSSGAAFTASYVKNAQSASALNSSGGTVDSSDIALNVQAINNLNLQTLNGSGSITLATDLGSFNVFTNAGAFQVFSDGTTVLATQNYPDGFFYADNQNRTLYLGDYNDDNNGTSIVINDSHSFVQSSVNFGINIVPAHALDVNGDINFTTNLLRNGVAFVPTQSISASFSTLALTSSFVKNSLSASYFTGSIVSSSYAVTASYALNSGGSGGTTLVTGSTYQITASWANNVNSSSYTQTASYVLSSSYAISSSRAITSSFLAATASFATTSSYALSSSYAISSSRAITSSFATTSSYVLSSSYSLNGLTSSFSNTSNTTAFLNNGNVIVTSNQITVGDGLGSSTGLLGGRLTINNVGASAINPIVINNAANQLMFGVDRSGSVTIVGTNSFVSASTFYGTSSYAVTASYALNGGTSAVTYNTLTTSSTSWITASFNNPKSIVNITTAGTYNFTCSNVPTGTNYLATSLVIKNTSLSSNTLTFPVDWTFIGLEPVTLPPTQSAYLQLEAFGTAIFATFGQSYK